MRGSQGNLEEEKHGEDHLQTNPNSNQEDSRVMVTVQTNMASIETNPIVIASTSDDAVLQELTGTKQSEEINSLQRIE